MTPQHRPVQTAGRVSGAADLTRERLADPGATAISGGLSAVSLPRSLGASDPSGVTFCCSSVTAAVRAASLVIRSAAV